MVRFREGAKGTDALIPTFSLALSYPAVSWAGETEDTERTAETGKRKRAKTSEDAVVYGPGGYVIGEDILPGGCAVFTGDTSGHSTYSTYTITLYKDDTDARRIRAFRFQHHGPISLHKGQRLAITKGYAVEASRASVTPGTAGMYKAGWGMEPGTYRITPFTSGSGYYALCSDMRYYYDHISEYITLFEPVMVDVANGRYLGLFDTGSIKRMPD